MRGLIALSTFMHMRYLRKRIDKAQTLRVSIVPSSVAYTHQRLYLNHLKSHTRIIRLEYTDIL